MPWRKWLTAAALLLIAVALAAANIWFAAVRSTIPLQLEAVVAGKEVRHEKHPPKDDVCLLDLGEGGIVHVDQAVFDAVAIGDRLNKSQWSTILSVNDRRLALAWSDDMRGMLWTMPLACGILLATAVWACRLP